MCLVNDLDLWHRRHRELPREAEEEHLARQRTAGHPKRVGRILSALLARVRARALEDARCA